MVVGVFIVSTANGSLFCSQLLHTCDICDRSSFWWPWRRVSAGVAGERRHKRWRTLFRSQPSSRSPLSQLLNTLPPFRSGSSHPPPEQPHLPSPVTMHTRCAATRSSHRCSSSTCHLPQSPSAPVSGNVARSEDQPAPVNHSAPQCCHCGWRGAHAPACPFK
ncbi:hypothetical protein AcW2_000483 [Taiwanofungus camphoratus]|nr:hypothetical protein AcW2_000483 [Antrodia cinnamomea]